MKKWWVMPLILLFSFEMSYAQNGRVKSNHYSVYRKKQFYIGVGGGANLTLPFVTKRYSVLTPSVGNDELELKKEYNKSIIENISSQFNAEMSYNFTNSIALVVGFGYHSYKFNYLTNYSWEDTIMQTGFAQEMKHRQTISYFTIPILVKYDITANRFSPYLQGGIFMDIAHRANKSVYFDHEIDEKVDVKNPVGKSPSTDMLPHFKRFDVGVVGGVGMSYHFRYFMIALDANFRYSFLPLVDNKNRYSDYTGLTLKYLDVMDQLTLGNVGVQLKILFPIDNSIRLNILRRTKYYKK